MAAWFLSGIAARWSAWAQIVAVMMMNVIEFFAVPDLLLFGHFNFIIAIAYSCLVARAELSPQARCSSPS